MFDDKSDRARVQDGTAIHAQPTAGDRSKGFKSRRMPPNAVPYKYLVVETGREIKLAGLAAIPMPASPIERYRERQTNRSINPIAVRDRLQGLLLDGSLVARLKLPSGVIVRVSSEVFGDNSEGTFDRMERGQPITALVFANDLLDASLDLDEVTGERAGVVFFYEEEFRAAQATDPITETDGYEVPSGTALAAPVLPAPVDDRAVPSGNELMGPAIPDVRSAARAISSSKPRGRKCEYPDLPKTVDDVLTSRTERYVFTKDFHSEIDPKLDPRSRPSDKTVERRAAKHPRWKDLKPLAKPSKSRS